MAMDLPEEISTQRLRLRRPHRHDGRALGQALSEAMVTLVPWFHWARVLSRWDSVDDLAVRAQVLEHRNREGFEWGWLMWQDGEVLGEVTLRTEGRAHGVLGYQVWLRPSAVGHGFGTEGSLAVLDAVGRSETVQWVEAECGYGNARSRGLLTRLGFERFGSTRDHERYVLEWR